MLMDCWNIYKKVQIRRVMPYTILNYPRLSKLYEMATYLERRKITGSFVECGVYNGGSAGIIASVFKNNDNRNIWLSDSWEGLPEPAENDMSHLGTLGQKGMAAGDEEMVKELLFNKLNLDSDKIHLVKGWFNATLPLHKKMVGTIALLHLDCDWHESVKFCLEELYDNVVKDGFIFIDDYGHWQGL
jgi:O-methyltransferase